MGHIGDAGHAEVQKTIDGALQKIVGAGRTAGTLATSGNVERYAKMGVRCFMTGITPWVEAGGRTLCRGRLPARSSRV